MPKGPLQESEESLRFQKEFFEALVAEDKDFEEALIPLGDTYTKLEEYEKGLKVDLVLSRLRPKDPLVFYNLACSCSLLGEIDQAYKAIETAIRLGYRDFQYLLRDSDLRELVNDEGFPDFLERILQGTGQ